MLFFLIHGFLGKQQYAAIALKRLTMKSSRILYLECSIFLPTLQKKLAKAICHTKYFYNFVFGDYW